MMVWRSGREQHRGRSFLEGRALQRHCRLLGAAVRYKAGAALPVDLGEDRRDLKPPAARPCVARQDDARGPWGSCRRQGV